MISLFHIPTHKVDTSIFSNLLHDRIVRQFEERFADYAGAKYAVSFNSATSAIFLALHDEFGERVIIPSIIPPVVPNAIINAGSFVDFEDDVEWVGDSYILHEWRDCKLIDSAQAVRKNQFAKEARPNDLMIFSFYPTKPVSSCDGGMIVSNDEAAIEKLRILSMNGMSPEKNSWDQQQGMIGHKMYMNSIQAYIADKNLKVLDFKKERLAEVREKYNDAFGLKNTSEHLYRVYVADNQQMVEKAKQAGIACGIHYQAAHLNKVISDYSEREASPKLLLSEKVARHTLSIPYHGQLSKKEVDMVIEFFKSKIVI